MNFINDRALARKFRENTVSSKERLYYFLISMMLMSVMTTSYLTNLLHAPVNEWDIATDILELSFTLIGILLLYKTNAKGDNKEFIERFICLSLPIAVQSIFLGIILAIVIFGVLAPGNLLNENPVSSIYDVLFIAIMMGYYYFRLNQSLKIASSNP